MCTFDRIQNIYLWICTFIKLHRPSPDVRTLISIVTYYVKKPKQQDVGSSITLVLQGGLIGSVVNNGRQYVIIPSLHYNLTNRKNDVKPLVTTCPHVPTMNLKAACKCIHICKPTLHDQNLNFDNLIISYDPDNVSLAVSRR